MKHCNGCQRDLPLGQFNVDVSRKDGLNPRCKDCLVHARIRRNTTLVNRLSKYSLTHKQYEAIWERQGGKCCGCLADLSQTITAIDHDHTCCPGEASCGACVRGILCTHCNRALGGVRDSIETLLRLVGYLQTQ